MTIATRLFALLLTAVVVLLPRAANADWPTQRHDAHRTGLATGVSNLTDPVPFFRYYLGGAIGGTQMLTYDVDGDSTPDIVYSSGGSVIAKKSNDTVIWKTKPMGFTNLYGVGDLDGDGKGDIIVYTLTRAVILEAATGVVQWVEPPNQMGAMSGVAIGDLDGDNKADLLVQECGCCGTSLPNTGYVFSFANGFGSAKQLYSLPYAACGASRSLLLVDADGVPPLEVMNNTYANFNILDGKTGQILASTPNQGSWTGSHYCRGHNVDGQPGDEILCVLNVSTQPATDQRKITVLKYTTNPASLSVLWSKIIAPDAGGDVTWTDPFVDLDGDGTIEVVVGTKEANDVWTTRVYDAASGSELGSISGQKLLGTASIEEANKALILTAAATTMSAYAFDANANPTIATRWSIADHTTLTEPDWTLLGTTSLFWRVLTLDLDGDKVDELITRTTNGASELVAYKATGMTQTKLASFALPPDVDVLRAWALPPIDVATMQIGLARNDGYLTLLDDKLKPSNAMFGYPGIRIGGYYAAGNWGNLTTTPAVGSLDASGNDAIVVRDSRLALLRLDASQATMANGPALIWQRTHTFGASIIEKLNGNGPGIASFAIKEPVTNPAEYRVVGLRIDGTELFDVPIGGVPLKDILPATLDQDGTTDLVFQWGNPTDTLQQTRGIAGLGGATLWDAVAFEGSCGRQPAGIAADDHDSDGLTDVLVHGASQLRVLSGKDGAQINASISVGGCYHMPTVYDLDGDNVSEVTLHASNNQPRSLSHDLQTVLWAGTDDDRPYPYGAIAPCSGGPVLVAASWKRPGRLKVTQLSGASSGAETTMVLAGGQKFVSESAAEFSGNYLGRLTATTVHTNLTGSGSPTALVGSADGWLYGIDPCNNALDFAINFGTAVGEAVFGDTDGDGIDEVLVTTADGYLYGLKNGTIEPPAVVLDTDPDEGITGFDVDNIFTADKLSGAWIATSGAAKYEVAIVEDGGGFITNPVWKDVGNVTSASVTGLPLTDGGKYFFVVRALHPNGDPSVDAISDGVTVQLDNSGGHGGSGGAGGGGGQGGQGGSTGGSGGAAEGGGGGDDTPSKGPIEVDSGCGCKLPGQPDQRPGTWLLVLALAAPLLRCSRKRRGIV